MHLRGIDIDVDNACVGSKFTHFPRHTIIEAQTNGNDQVADTDGAIHRLLNGIRSTSVCERDVSESDDDRRKFGDGERSLAPRDSDPQCGNDRSCESLVLAYTPFVEEHPSAASTVELSPPVWTHPP